MRHRLPLALLALATPFCASAATTPAYSVSGSIAGPDGTWDYAQADDTGRVFIARGNGVTIVNTSTGAVTSLSGVQHGHAAVPLPNNRLLVTSATDGTARIFDLASGQQTASIPVGKDPDAAVLDPAKTHAYVMNAESGTVSVIDLATAKVSQTIKVRPALEFAAFASDGTMFVNNEDASEIDAVDVAHGTLGTPIAMPGCKGPTGIAYDKAGNRLISVCANGKAAIVDAETRRLVKLIDIGIGPDAVLLDEARGLAFIPCGKAGVLEVLALSAGGVDHVATVKTELGAKTGALDLKTGTIYLPTAKFGPPEKAGGRPVRMPGTFHVLIVRPS